MSSRQDGEGGAEESSQPPVNALGTFIRVQRQLAHMSLREVAALTSVSNAYLSQIERGLHQPSLRVLRSIAQALSIAPEELLRRANFLSTSNDADATTAAGPDTTHPDAAHPDAAHTEQRAAGPHAGPDTEAAIVSDPKLTPRQREALLNVYRSFRDSG
jgi:transcriptional regulator with XRE-family HTH domain